MSAPYRFVYVGREVNAPIVQSQVPLVGHFLMCDLKAVLLELA